MKQEKLSNQLVVSGIPKVKDEKIIDIMLKIGDKLNVKIENDEIVQARRMEKQNADGKNYTAPILITFKNDNKKLELLQKRKTLGKL